MDPGETISEDALRFFASAAGVRLLDLVQRARGDEFRTQTLLRREFSPELCRAAIALTELRRRSRGRFELGDSMYFDRQGLEMASRTELARHRARRLCAGGLVADLCCGIGGDLMELARAGHVVGVDLDRRRAHMARMNAELVSACGVATVVADVLHWYPSADVLFIDPARRRGLQRRSRSGAGYAPPLGFALGLLDVRPAVAIKVSPAIDEGELPEDWEVEFVSAAGQCREGVLYGGSLVSARRRATVFPGAHTLTAQAGVPVPVGPPGGFLLEPDPAVVRAHLVEELARLVDAWKLDPEVAYLSADAWRATAFGCWFRILAVLPYHLKRLRSFLRGEDMRPVEIKRRRFPIAPEELLARLGRWRGTRPVTLILTRLQEQLSCLVCERMS